MISYIRGKVADVGADKVILDVNGIGYGIFMPGTSMAQLPPYGSEMKLYTYLDVRQDAMQLFGFLTREDLELFKLLIRVSGIGPKGGLSILSRLSADELRFAILSGDVKAITAAQGIGRKTAEKLIIELKDKLDLEDSFRHLGEPVSSDIAGASSEAQSEAVQALTALGYGSTESLKAVRQVEGSGLTVEELLKAALKYLL